MGHGGQVGHQCVHRMALCQQLSQQCIGVDHQPGNLVAAGGQHSGDIVGVGQQLAKFGVAGVEGIGEARHPLQRDLQVGRGVGKRLRQCGEGRGQLRGVQAADGGGEVPQRGRQVVRGRRPFDGDGTGEAALAARGDLKHLGAEHGFGLDRGLGPVAQFYAITDRELHPDLRPFQPDAGDPAHTETGHPHVTAGFDATGLGEVGGVVGGALDERKPVVEEGREHQCGQGKGSSDAHGHPVALGERFDPGSADPESPHLGVHRPLGWLTSLTYTGWPPLPLSLSSASHR
ncbi:hypothetical protein C1Y40_01893 [Mycobacterium talmoniae]|uniref:Uncharacterized protein n=1 Tax=Mycobacterium talmoniae TaxID=1858794 RepID=A0A2S8BMN1_9MYCO|nr:hypothetical protein C1Y40_01893 [Mycobacterium talmoniae]